jgi:RNA polymerase sigma-70 factor (ECF subfamily)
MSAEEATVGTTVRTFEEFYEDTAGRLFTALCQVSGNQHEAEEVTQDSFVRVFERWDRVRSLEDPAGYLFRVSMNVVRSRVRRTSLSLRAAPLLVAPRNEDLVAVENRDAVDRLLRRLKPRQHAAVWLTEVLEFSAEETGRILGVRASSVRSLTTRARARLRHEIADPV